MCFRFKISVMFWLYAGLLMAFMVFPQSALHKIIINDCVQSQYQINASKMISFLFSTGSPGYLWTEFAESKL